MCLSNDEVEPQWMTVLETESVFKNFIYILENSLNGKVYEIFKEIGTISQTQKQCLAAGLILFTTTLYSIVKDETFNIVLLASLHYYRKCIAKKL